MSAQADLAARAFLAFDLGASSVRLLEGCYQGGELSLCELSRISHEAVTIDGKLVWQMAEILDWMHDSLHSAAANISENGCEYTSLGIDTWGVDYALLDSQGQELGPVLCYRDSRTKGIYQQIQTIIEPQELYQCTGAQFMEPNTLCQLMAQLRDDAGVLEQAGQLLMLPSYLNYKLCGKAVNEATHASTSQLFDIRKKSWNLDLIHKLGLPTKIFTKFQAPGSVLAPQLDGELLKDMRGKPKNMGSLKSCQMIQVASHDSASALLAIPFQDDTAKLFLSSGTWSVMGIELEQPILSPEARKKNFANELSFDGSVRFLRSLPGLWLLQELRRDLQQQEGRNYSFEELEDLARSALPYNSLIATGHDKLLRPGEMSHKIQSLCCESGEAVPQNAAGLVRCIYDSLALEYRSCAADIMALSGRQIQVMHVVGGGAQSTLLNQLCADSLGLPVLAGPIEAAGLGNILAQLTAAGICRSPAETRSLVQKSFAVQEFWPQIEHRAQMEQAFIRYQNICLETL